MVEFDSAICVGNLRVGAILPLLLTVRAAITSTRGHVGRRLKSAALPAADNYPLRAHRGEELPDELATTQHRCHPLRIREFQIVTKHFSAHHVSRLAQKWE